LFFSVVYEDTRRLRRVGEFEAKASSDELRGGMKWVAYRLAVISTLSAGLQKGYSSLDFNSLGVVIRFAPAFLL